MTLTVICPIYNEEKYIGQFLDSILQQDYPKDDLEILLVDGMSKDSTKTIVAEYTTRYSFIRLIDNPDKTVPYAMNRGIEGAQGDVILRLDAHAEYPRDYFSKLVKYLKELEGAENVGGVCVTLPCNESSTAIAIAECLSNKFGMGNSYFRIGASKIMSVDTVPFGCFHKSLFERIGLYDTDMIRNQDDELNGRIIKNGGKIYLIPDIQIKYFSRDKISKVRKMFYQYGLYKPLGNKKLGAPATIRQFFPLLFTIGLFVGFILSCFSPLIAFFYVSIIALHLLLGFTEGTKSSIRHKRAMVAFLMPYIFFSIHVCYGWGYMNGLYRVFTNKPFNATSNR